MKKTFTIPAPKFKIGDRIYFNDAATCDVFAYAHPAKVKNYYQPCRVFSRFWSDDDKDWYYYFLAGETAGKGGVNWYLPERMLSGNPKKIPPYDNHYIKMKFEFNVNVHFDSPEQRRAQYKRATAPRLLSDKTIKIN